MTKTEDVTVGCITFVLVLVAMVALTLFDGVAFQHLWNWFLPHALNAPRIGTVDALGISTLIGWATLSVAVKREEDPRKVLYYAFVATLTVFAMGWIILQFR